MRLYHTTEVADKILEEGFRDGEGQYMTANTYRGVWLADMPLDVNEGAWGEDVLVVEMPEAVVAQYEWAEERKAYREFLVPAATVNLYPVCGKFSVYDEKFFQQAE